MLYIKKMPLNPTANHFVPFFQQIDTCNADLKYENDSIKKTEDDLCIMEFIEMSNRHMAQIGVPMNEDDDFSAKIRAANSNLEIHKKNKKKLESMISSLRLQNNIIMAISQDQLRLILTGQIRICVNIA